MNDEEVLKDLLLEPKSYNHIGMSQSQFSNTIIRYRAGLLKPNTFRGFIEKFGYIREGSIWLESSILNKARERYNKSA